MLWIPKFKWNLSSELIMTKVQLTQIIHVACFLRNGTIDLVRMKRQMTKLVNLPKEEGMKPLIWFE